MALKNILVTGASGVIGNAICRALLDNNMHVHAHYFSQRHSFSTFDKDAKIRFHQTDLRNPDQVKVLFNTIPSIDAVIHAAAFSQDNLVARTSIAQWQETMQVNLNGTFYVLQNALERLPDGGRTVILGSRVGEHGNHGQAAYAASKAGVIALAQTAAREAAARHISINVLCPPFVPSKMAEQINPQREAQMLFKDKSPQDALDAICSAVLWLLSKETKFITGQVLHPDGRIGFGTAGGFI